MQPAARTTSSRRASWSMRQVGALDNTPIFGNVDVFRGAEINLESSSYAVGALGAREKHDVSNGTFGTQIKARPGANSQNLQAEVVTQR